MGHRTVVAVAAGILATSTVTGCGGLEEDLDPSSAMAPIVAGYTTTQRPEVGQVSGTGSCTATLISNRHFLTAAHCYNHAPQYRGGTLRLDYSGTSYTYDVDRVFSQRISQAVQTGSDDIAVGRLKRKVTSAIKPASIATLAVIPSWRTVMGYGCTMRYTGNGSGTKRYRQFWYSGGISQWICAGDSGGPLFAGKLSQKGSIVGVNSGWWPDNGEDVFGDAVKYRSHILALTTAMEKDGICYRAHVQNKGWMPAVCNSSTAGTTYKGLRMEAIQIWSARPGVKVCYRAYLQGTGWQGTRCDGDMSGTTGQSRRLEALRIWLASAPSGESVYYRAHVQNTGWQYWRKNGQTAGTTGKSLRLEAIRIKLQ